MTSSSTESDSGATSVPGEAGAAYLADLAGRLRAAGLPDAEVTATVADLGGYLAESGSPDPYEEFGAPQEFAARLTSGRVDERPEAGAETWKWAADIYTDRKYLNHYGDQGWEVEGLDRLGRFVCRRSPDAAMRWEYRRETAVSLRDRPSIVAGLVPEGWEPCGQWLYFLYFKRPKAATAGPAARLDDLPATPDQRLFLGRTYRGKLKQFLVSGLVSALVVGLAVHFGGARLGLPMLIGACVAAPVGFAIAWRRLKREGLAGTGDA
ncbi:hypothetical protein OG455_21540 [Kitasatospora sp. NBC_01287]|uniref:hypothetical protein n=1 Tax=Kitasatospora sp. NBC_01287 TaxID=2903573 RepID=UPI00225250EA|nr:hypothetical protein [Kitasatospora sp. NBC_01287]MCX4748066.1 hypothetical protein [Kitasatospora sp. NBC_01287]